MTEKNGAAGRLTTWSAVVLGAVLALALLRARTNPRHARATVSIYDDGAPLADRWVVFHAGDGSVLATVKSGADGKASGAMEPGGMITVAYGASIQQLVTIVGVQPNDEVVVGEHDNDEGEAGRTATIAKVVLPGAYRSADSGHAGAARYGVSLGVGMNDVADAGAPIRLPVMQRFLGAGGRFQVLGLAFDDDGTSLAYTFAEAPARDAGTDTDVVLPAWRTDWREERLVLGGGAGAWLKEPAVSSVKADFSTLTGAERFDHSLARRPIAPSGTETTLAFAIPRPLAATASYRIELAYGSKGRAILVRRDAKMPAEVRIDLGDALLPRIDAVTTELRSDIARPLLRWTVDGDVTKADAAILQVSWPATKEHLWTILLPPTTKPGFELPALPNELATWRPRAEPLGAAVALVEASEYASYDDVKKKWIHLLGETPEKDGTIRLSISGDIDF